ncbi:MAG: amidase [Alphaproteobacteria bacterium]
MSGFSAYGDYDASGLAELVRRGEVSALELVEEAIARAEALGSELNAVVTPMYEAARAQASAVPDEAPFAGVPFLLKDLGPYYAGVRMCFGARFLEDFVPDHDGELVRRYKRAGLICFGKTNAPELGLTPVTEPELFGPTRNPWREGVTPGGSSGGSAAAVAAAIVPMAHGNDGGGSIRIPASCCGLFGLKPSRARNPVGPDVGEAWHGAVVDHVLSRSVRDSAAALDASHGAEVGDPYAAPAPARPYAQEVGADPGRLRIAFSARPPFPAAVHPDCVTALHEAAALCEDLGHAVEEARPELDGAALSAAFLLLIAAETAAEIESWGPVVGREPRAADFEVETWVLGLLGNQYSAKELAAAVKTLRLAGRTVGHFLEEYDLLLTPTLAQPPIALGALKSQGAEALAQRLIARFSLGSAIKVLGGIDRAAERVFAFIPFTPLANITGQPAMSLPLNWNSDGLPVGVQFAARFGDEATLFRLAAQLEEAHPWAQRRPPLSA